MKKNKTHFIHIFGYGLIVLWITMLIVALVFSVIDFASGYGGFADFLDLTFYITLFGIPISALLALLIGGSIWLILRKSNLSNSVKACLAGGLSSAFPVAIILALEFNFGYSPITSLRSWIIPLCLAVLGFWCGWLGERLARRHVKVDPKSISKTFE